MFEESKKNKDFYSVTWEFLRPDLGTGEAVRRLQFQNFAQERVVASQVCGRDELTTHSLPPVTPSDPVKATQGQLHSRHTYLVNHVRLFHLFVWDAFMHHGHNGLRVKGST